MVTEISDLIPLVIGLGAFAVIVEVYGNSHDFYRRAKYEYNSLDDKSLIQKPRIRDFVMYEIKGIPTRIMGWKNFEKYSQFIDNNPASDYIRLANQPI